MGKWKGVEENILLGLYKIDISCRGMGCNLFYLVVKYSHKFLQMDQSGQKTVVEWKKFPWHDATRGTVYAL